MSGLIGSLRFGNSNTSSVFVAGNYAYVINEQGGLEVVNISDPNNPMALGSYAGLNAPGDVVVEGSNAYVADAAGLEIFDVSNPASPLLLGTLPIADGLSSVIVSGNYAYIADFNSHAVRLVNISDPSTPTVVSSIITPSEGGPGSPVGFALSGNYLYVADFSPGIDVIDVSDPAHPALVTTFSNLPHSAPFHVGPGVTSSPTALAVSGHYLYVADQDTGLYILNIANPAAPVEVSSYDPGGAGNRYTGVQVEGTVAYVTDTSGKLIELDISDPTHPTLLGSYGIGGSPNGLSVSGDYAYVANDTRGLADVKIGPWSILSNPADVNESGGSATFTIERLDSSAATTVYLSTTQDQGSSNQGDYIGTSDQAITFAAGQATQTVTVQILNDHVAEPDETFGLIVQASANDPASSYLASTTFTIFDDDRTQAIQAIPNLDVNQQSHPQSLPSISADGRYVAYFSGYVSNNYIDNGQIFVYDRVTNTTELISGPDLNGAAGFSQYTPKPQITPDGRFVVWSEYEARVDGSSNFIDEVLVHDGLTNTTELISKTSDGSPAFGILPSISSDGRYVAYTTFNGGVHIEIYDRLSRATEEVPGSSAGGSFSADDRYLAYASADGTGTFIYDRSTQQITVVSSSSGGFAPSISADGRYVAYLDGTQDVYVYDRTANSTELVSRSSDGTIANRPSTDPAISSDGRYIVFNSLASNLVPNDTNGVSDTFVYDRVTHTTTRVSIANDGTQGNGGSFSGDFVASDAISSDGQFVAFASDASNLVPGDTNGTTDIFVVNQLPPAAINHPPVIDTAHSVLTGVVDKVPNAPASTTPDTAQGTITFTDSNLATTTATVPTATVVFRDAQGLIESIAGYSTDVLLAFQIGPVTSSSNVGSVDWTYSIPNSELSWLGANGTATVTASVQINDGQGDPTTPAVVTVTIHGANDPPVIDLTNSVVSGTTSQATIGGTVEDVTHGTLAFSDPNVDDLPTGSVTGQSVVGHDSAGNVITLTQAQIAELASAFSIMPAPGNTNAGTIEWSYALPDQLASFLSAGESATITSTIQVDDHNGGKVSQNLTVQVEAIAAPQAPTLQEYYTASDAVYKDNVVNGPMGVAPSASAELAAAGLKFALDSRDPSIAGSPTWLADGFFAQAFTDASGHVILSFEGTTPTLSTPYGKGTLAADGDILGGIAPQSFFDAVAFTKIVEQRLNVSVSNIFFTGHSLGGAEAEDAAFTLDSGNMNGVTFGAPGDPTLQSAFNSPGFTDYVDYGDPVGNFGNHFGTVKYVGSPLDIAVDIVALGTGFDALGVAEVYHSLDHYAADLSLNSFDTRNLNDGYIAGATVFADANGNGKLDAGEVSTTTDSNGNFTLVGGTGPLVAFGGTDISTGLAFQGNFTAPAGSLVITPLTTLVSSLQGHGLTMLQAEQSVLASLGLNAAVDLTSLDPVAGTQAGDATSAAVFEAGIKIVNTVETISSALVTDGGSYVNSSSDAFGSIASMISTLGVGQTLNLSDQTAVLSLVNDVGQTDGVSVNQNAAQTAATITQSNTQLDQDLKSAQSGTDLLSDVSLLQLDSSKGIIAGGHGNDTFQAGGGNKTFDGGGGHDTIIFDGSSSQYTLVVNTDGSVTSTDSIANRDGVDTLINVEFLQFTDKTVFVENPDNANIARLYSAAYDRAPDIAGLNFWEDVYAANVSTSAKSAGYYTSLAQTDDGSGTSIAANFIASSEFQNRYGSLTDTAFVTQLYQNILGRTPDQAGLNFWVGELEGGGQTRAVVLVGFAESPENVEKTGGDWLIQT